MFLNKRCILKVVFRFFGRLAEPVCSLFSTRHQNQGHDAFSDLIKSVLGSYILSGISFSFTSSRYCPWLLCFLHAKRKRRIMLLSFDAAGEVLIGPRDLTEP